MITKNPYHMAHILLYKFFYSEILVSGRIVTEFTENYKITYLYWNWRFVMTLN